MIINESACGHVLFERARGGAVHGTESLPGLRHGWLSRDLPMIDHLVLRNIIVINVVYNHQQHSAYITCIFASPCIAEYLCACVYLAVLAADIGYSICQPKSLFIECFARQN